MERKIETFDGKQYEAVPNIIGTCRSRDGEACAFTKEYNTLENNWAWALYILATFILMCDVSGYVNFHVDTSVFLVTMGICFILYIIATRVYRMYERLKS